jgi:hypothetical protein
MPTFSGDRRRAVAYCCAAILTFASAAAAQTTAERQEMRRIFLKQVDAYVALHRDLEQLVPPQVVTANADELLAPRIGLARELRLARAWAREGNIFAPDVAVYFRVVIAETLGRTTLEDVVDPELAVHITALVNADYPAGRSVPKMPAALLSALPPLPPELRYSFVDRDLILWDLHAALIVDIVRDALPLTSRSELSK